ncbi:Detected protein of confused Function [Hibiscus syriacus]|uniref:Detected protein of confused Function n=1 Tax=Hibiscus syriacus TaxID=106335 RepID=A0A6A3CX64_HIBSY|nr:Detected protein of confused Function [Hibiscus syriacus]
MQTRTVQVKNLSDLATEREIHEFFSFSGDIEHIEIISETSQLKTAYVTFKDPKALEIALLLSGATLVDKIVNIISAENYVPKLEIHESRAADGIMSVSPAGHSASNDESTGLTDDLETFGFEFSKTDIKNGFGTSKTIRIELDFDLAESLTDPPPHAPPSTEIEDDTGGLGTAQGTRWCGRCRKRSNDRR